MSPFAVPEQQELHRITVRRMLDGSLALLLGEDRISGLMHLAAIDDGEHAVLNVQFAMSEVFFDTEKPRLDNLN